MASCLGDLSHAAYVEVLVSRSEGKRSLGVSGATRRVCAAPSSRPKRNICITAISVQAEQPTTQSAGQTKGGQGLLGRSRGARGLGRGVRQRLKVAPQLATS